MQVPYFGGHPVWGGFGNVGFQRDASNHGSWGIPRNPASAMDQILFRLKFQSRLLAWQKAVSIGCPSFAWVVYFLGVPLIFLVLEDKKKGKKEQRGPPKPQSRRRTSIQDYLLENCSGKLSLSSRVAITGRSVDSAGSFWSEKVASKPRSQSHVQPQIMMADFTPVKRPCIP